MGKYDRTKEQDLEIVHRVHTLAERYGVKMQQIALAWHWCVPHHRGHQGRPF